MEKGTNPVKRVISRVQSNAKHVNVERVFGDYYHLSLSSIYYVPAQSVRSILRLTNFRVYPRTDAHR